MKKQYLLPIWGFCAMILSAACSDDDYRTNDFSQPGENTIFFSCQSKLNNDEVVWKKDSKLGFFCDQTQSENVALGVAAVCIDQTEGLFYTQLPWSESGGEHTFYLYSPYNAANVSATSIAGVINDVQNQTGTSNAHLAQNALTYAVAKSTKKDNEAIPMNFKHALGYLDFNCTSANKYEGWNVKSIELSNEDQNVLLTGDYGFDMTTSKFVMKTGNPKVLLRINSAPALTKGVALHGYAAVNPINLTSQYDVKITLEKAEEDDLLLTQKLVPGNLVAGSFTSLILNLDEMTEQNVPSNVIDLSSVETANCYITGIPGQEYCFKATVMGNGKTTPATIESNGSSAAIIPSVLAPKSAQILWQSEKDLISGVKIKGNNIYFTTNGSESTSLIEGNAVIAAYSDVDGKGDILWSWHVWVTVADLNAKVQTYKVHNLFADYSIYQSPVMMDRNLGATASEFWTAANGNKDAHGLFYQWGRKDPFVGPSNTSLTAFAPVYDNNGEKIDSYPVIVKTAVSKEYLNKKPMEFYATGGDWLSEAGITNLWGNLSVWDSKTPSGDAGTKSIYDPCPPGYQVPHPCVWSNFTTQGVGDQKPIADFPLNLISGASADLKTTGGLVFNCDNNGARAVYPGIGFIDFKTGALARVAPASNGRCDYWANASMGSTLGCRFFTDANNCGTSTNGARSYGFGVRCMKIEK